MKAKHLNKKVQIMGPVITRKKGCRLLDDQFYREDTVKA